ncbi:hypothetical protein ACTMU2_13900 [Cupriavidus basilensis]
MPYSMGRPLLSARRKPTSFSDFWRDLKDIGTEDLFRPMILNADEPIRNMDTNKVEIKAAKTGELRRIMDAKLSVRDAGYNIMFATYSQFNREAIKSKKADWISDGVKGRRDDPGRVPRCRGRFEYLRQHCARSRVHCDARHLSRARRMPRAPRTCERTARSFQKAYRWESLADTLAVGAASRCGKCCQPALAEEGAFSFGENTTCI